MDSTPPSPEAESPLPEAAAAPGRPPVWPWFVVYCWFTVLVCLICAISGISLLSMEEGKLATYSSEPGTLRAQGAFLAVAGIALLGLHAAAPFLPRKSWAWTLDLVLLCIGVMSFCCLLPAAPLLLLWMREDVQVYFGRPRRTVD